MITSKEDKMAELDRILERLSEIDKTLVGHTHQIKSLKHRMDKGEEQQETISALAQSVNELAINMRYMLDELKKQGIRLDKLEQEPKESYKYYKRLIIGYLFTGVISAIMGAVCALIFK